MVIVLSALVLCAYGAVYFIWGLYCADYNPPGTNQAKLCQAFPDDASWSDLAAVLVPTALAAAFARAPRARFYSASGVLVTMAVVLFVMPLVAS